jgi:hypothetical protein
MNADVALTINFLISEVVEYVIFYQAIEVLMKIAMPAVMPHGAID